MRHILSLDSFFKLKALQITAADFCRGLCTILRSAAGGQDCVTDWDSREYKNNSHWLEDDGAADGEPQDSNFVCYYDAASLYPSSGKTNSSEFLLRPARAGACLRARELALRASRRPAKGGPTMFSIFYMLFLFVFGCRARRHAGWHWNVVCHVSRKSQQVGQRK